MGSCCCHTESPCGSVEERSGLLKNDSKTTAATGEPGTTGTCGPEGDDDKGKTSDEANIKAEVKAEVTQIPEVGETEPKNTQENGPSPDVVVQTGKTTPRKLEENSTRAQDEDVKDGPADSGRAELLNCTLNSPQSDHAAAGWEVFTPEEEEKPAVPQDKIPDSSSVNPKVCCENQPETNTTRERVTLATAHDSEEEEGSKAVDNAAAEPSGEFSQNKEVLSVPNTQPTAAAYQPSSEIDRESPSCAVTDDSDNGSPPVCREASPEVTRSHDVSESSPGSEPTGLNHSAEERDSANCVDEPETAALADMSESSKPDQDAKPDLECATPSSKEVTSSENIKQVIREETMQKGQDEDVPRAEENNETRQEVEIAPEEVETPKEAEKDAEIQELAGKEEQLAGSSSTDVEADGLCLTKKEDSAEDGLGNSEEDLYRGAEELSASQENKAGPPAVLETSLLKVEDRCSLAPAMDILSYSEREWKGNTAKSALIRKGYKEMSQRFGRLRRVRGDNYCALRATLFQVLSHSTQLPVWLQEEDITMLPKQLEAQEGLISHWMFPGDCLQGDGTGDAALQLKGYMELLRNKWQAAVDCSSAAERQQQCERVFQGGEDELGLLEALKLLMLGRAVELHGCMQAGGDVPLFCWLLFARDSSDCPRSFLSNHLSHVGLSAGLEQVEMFLLGYALQCTIQVYRLYKADTEEFVTYYPDDHKDDWPSVCLVTEDDRHYNVPVVEAAELKELNSS
ncbi:histone-lysine N-methyltransferase SETD1A [Larimichthys crocea]|uniref:histone-lysine N-methyltransferase SETD1A n=1 Tax=Larimichthys crocea TaxID=215358 RepID=UPI000F6006A0|nr:ubiquitin thioesterase otulin [Larimichthys crocea]XP_019127203.2 ubiquitin thioesterase otulin [Larimichthys crocea]XP_019127205.2 ubiquitin thioesterase otulin [Larimichthys crocea]XP_019127206.2 ubiquitin thioesterase otulin [Larimichthys crocea]XP_027129976.1 ubiquitin thioesterase otulin [Larimichthys crocea]